MVLLNGFVLIMCTMIAAWLVFCWLNNPAIIDVFWGLNITGIGILYLSSNGINLVTLVPLILLLAWGIRLSFFLFQTRIAKGHYDRRYQDLSENWKSIKLGFLAQYLLQGCLAWLIAIPFYTLPKPFTLNLQTIVAMLLVIVGLIGETISDIQLIKHKRIGAKTTYRLGLWRYSRHPNYFFECLVWAGFSLMGFYFGLGILSVISIATLFSVMWFITIPMTEEGSLKRKGEDFQNYINTTSRFIPWWPKS